MSIKFSCEIKGLNNLEKKISRIAKELPQKVEESIEDILKNIQGYAIRIENGNNSQGILVEMVETSTMTSKGRIYADPSKFMTENNQSYLWFEYFGTGRICRKRTYWKDKTLSRKSVIQSGIYQ